ncbi:MAG: tRNA nucleotidyltransferase, partial [Bacteroidota bacterium]|nr:tRNA nucleotidyltransferase [Bacteroidota bacterium]
MTTDKNLHQAFSDPIFSAIGEIAEKMQTRAFAIGGCVRDALMQRKNIKDIDIVCENSGITLAKAVADQLPNAGKLNVYENYGTAMIRVGAFKLEFVGARKESYKKNSRNPVVESGSLADDQK